MRRVRLQMRRRSQRRDPPEPTTRATSVRPDSLQTTQEVLDRIDRLSRVQRSPGDQTGERKASRGWRVLMLVAGLEITIVSLDSAQLRRIVNAG